MVTVSIPNTGGWKNWVGVSMTAKLLAGTYSVTVTTSSTLFNMNYFTLTKQKQVDALTAETC